jgi:hypothetical protein
MRENDQKELKELANYLLIISQLESLPVWQQEAIFNYFSVLALIKLT